MGYENNQIAYGYSGDGRYEYNRQIYDRLKLAKSVRVRYDPADPSRATLACGVTRDAVGIILLGVAFFSMPAGMAAVLVLLSRRETALLSSLVVVTRKS